MKKTMTKRFMPVKKEVMSSQKETTSTSLSYDLPSEMIFGSLSGWKYGEFVPVSSPVGIYYGGFQGWLTQEDVSKFYADRSCGVTAASNLFYYMAKKVSGQSELYDRPNIAQSEFSAFQKEVYDYVSPALWGVPTLETMIRCVKAYACAKGVSLKAKKTSAAWTEEAVRDYISEGLNMDRPVLLLTWNSPIHELRMHWITVTRLFEREGILKIVASNWAGMHTYDFSSWVKGSSLYKGVIYFE